MRYVDILSACHKVETQEGIPKEANCRLKLNTPSPLYNFPPAVSHADKTIKLVAGLLS